MLAESTSIKDIVKDTFCELNRIKCGVSYWLVSVNGVIHEFPISLSEFGESEWTKLMKSITLMRWIRKAIEEKTLVEYNVF